jgi:hypothetical protein
LVPLNDCNWIGGNRRQEIADLCCEVRRGNIKDGELNIWLSGNSESSTCANQLEGKVIEPGSEVVEDVAQDASQVRGHVWNVSDPHDVVAGLRIVFEDRYYRVGMEGVLPVRMESFQMMLRPLQFGLHAIEGTSHGA